MPVLAEIVEYLGIHKNSLFVFVLLSAKFIHGEGKDLMEQKEPWVHLSGVVLHFCPVLMIAAALVFYFWAFRNEPGSVQEREFEYSSQRALKKHRAASRRRTR